MARLAAFDMDGTLLLPTHQLGSETLASLHALHQRNVTLTFATGRHLHDMQALRDQFTLPAWLITGNGTRIHDPAGKQLYGCDLPPAVAEEALHRHWQTPASVHVFNDEGWFTDKPLPGMLEAHAMSGFHYQLRDLRRMPAHKVTKICFIAPHAMLLALKSELVQALGDRANICFSAWDCLEVLPVGCHKGAALARLCQHLSLTLAECMAFGDAMNDREMLEQVGKGFIMANAMHQLKASLPHLPVIGHCETQAVSHYLNHWMTTPHLAYSPEC
ncbi:HMP-PP phosphatase [Candidatus Pantoea soli]|uniref:HMP-PP phosphatase n=1 Tax=Candidatus Pantoea soli TaxID=3098669 RepID=A0A518XAK3_9GAMM|nr:HMP-PP phosphatase [Pantoea soli]QDY41224.1 HMP-PP phosphatase [Pantoea soli]